MEKTQIMELLLKVIDLGETFLLPVGNSQTAFHSLRVRLYRARQELDRMRKGVGVKIEISQTVIDEKKYLLIKPEQLQEIYKLVNGKPVSILSNIENLNKAKRVLTFMLKDEIPEEEILQMIEGLGEEKEEALKFYNSIKE